MGSEAVHLTRLANDDIVDQVSKLIEKKHLIQEQGYKSMDYVKKYFHHVKVAEKYLKAWGQKNN